LLILMVKSFKLGSYDRINIRAFNCPSRVNKGPHLFPLDIGASRLVYSHDAARHCYYCEIRHLIASFGLLVTHHADRIRHIICQVNGTLVLGILPDSGECYDTPDGIAHFAGELQYTLPGDANSSGDLGKTVALFQHPCNLATFGLVNLAHTATLI